MKKKILLFIIALLLMLNCSNVYAFETYYTNPNGVELTEQQYNNLSKALKKEVIDWLPQEIIDEFKDDENLTAISYSKYIRTDSYFDSTGKITRNIDTVVTEEEALKFLKEEKIINRSGSYPVHQTTMKRLTIDVTYGSADLRNIYLTLEWLSMPVTRSHDVIGVRIPSSFTVHTSNSGITGKLKHNGSTVQTYYKNSSNVRSLSTGAGISMPLPTGGTSMEVDFNMTVYSNADPFNVYGSYQHAQSTVSLSDSKVYNINSNGLGGVLDFTNSTTRAKYDAMGGVYCSRGLMDYGCY